MCSTPKKKFTRGRTGWALAGGHPHNSMATPHATWYERSDFVFLTVKLVDASDVTVDFTSGTHLTFEAHSGSDRYAFDLQWPHDIDPEASKWTTTSREVSLRLIKREPQWWRRLAVSVPGTFKTDWDNFEDEDEDEPSSPPGGGFDFSNMMSQFAPPADQQESDDTSDSEQDTPDAEQDTPDAEQDVAQEEPAEDA